ncbi:MAG: ABC transporter substrate-binding protein [Rhizomicrobium sp.]
MRLTHGIHASALMAAFLSVQPANAAPQRIVSTFLCTDEYVFRLVPRARIAALSFLAADTHPIVSTIRDQVKGIPLTRGSAEEVMSLNPDLVVMYRGTNPRLKAQLMESHIPFVEVAWANSLADVRAVTRDLGASLGAPQRAAELIAKMDEELADASSIAPRPAVRTLVYEPNGYANSGGLSDDIMHAAGLIDVASQMGQTRLGTIPVEAVVAAPPELLVLNAERDGAPSRGDLILRHPALRALPRSTMVAGAILTPLLCPGPWSVDAAAPLARLGRAARKLASASSGP